ncbi:hypothetical protein EMCRGX_G015537 [Ephydatia muelleri]
MLALVWAVHIFRPYLYGKRFTLRTDHNCLKWLHNVKEPEGQVARWLEALAEFDYEVVHNAVVPKGHSRKFCRPWLGPFKPQARDHQSCKMRKKRGSISTLMEGPNTDAAPAPAPAEQLRGREQGPNDLLQEIPHAVQPEVVPTPAPPLRRSGRRTQPPARYGQPLIVPDSIPENVAVGE